MGFINLDLFSLIYRLPAIVLALSVHEFAHARMAYAFGDPTAQQAGRLTLNPLKHLDVLGTLMLMLFGFGWAKPVPVNSYYFQGNRAQKMMYVAGAGPISNFLQALLMAGLLSGLLHFIPAGNNLFLGWLVNFLYYFILINLVLMVFNLIPVPPLDGSKILAGLLPERHQNIIYQLDRYALPILLLAMWLGLFNRIISPVAMMLFNAIMRLVGLPELSI